MNVTHAPYAILGEITLTYGKTTKTACARRVTTTALVGRDEATCPDCVIQIQADRAKTGEIREVAKELGLEVKPFTVFFGVLARDEEVVKRYLYDHAEVVTSVESSRSGVQFVVVKVSSEISAANVRYLADNQRARLSSGLYPSTDLACYAELTYELARATRWL